MLQPNVYARIAAALEGDWRILARPEQLPPDWAWTIWAILAGRGWGKTRSGAEWIKSKAEIGPPKRFALVAPTMQDVRSIMIEGESGLLTISSPHCRPVFEPSRRLLTWPNGSTGHLYSAEEPDRLRGPQHHFAWCDELAAWAFPDAWDMLSLGLRLGEHPQCVVTTTPRPVKLIKDLVARRNADVALTGGDTFQNSANLAPSFLTQIRARYEGTRLGRQELNAEILADVEGALWNMARIDELRVTKVPDLQRVVVAIDPAVTSGEKSDETGIIVVGLGEDGHGYVVEDLSGKFSPTEWARRAVEAYHRHAADRIIAEANQGGDMVETTVRMVDPNASFKAVRASRGKFTRAEPVSALYEQGRVHHVAAFPVLEDQMCSFTPDFDRAKMGTSPDRLDALVWGLTELIVDSAADAWLAHYAELASTPAPAQPQAAALPWHRTQAIKPGDDGGLLELYRKTYERSLFGATSGAGRCKNCSGDIDTSHPFMNDGFDRWHITCPEPPAPSDEITN